MNPRVTLAFVIVLVALAGYVYFFGLQADDETGGGEVGLEPLGTTYGEYDLIALEVEGHRGTARFARTAGTFTQDWEMLQPDSLPPDRVDQVRVNGAATRLGRLTASQVITNVSDLAQYGLDPPGLTVTLTISNGQNIVLHAGAETPVDDNRYLRLPGDNGPVYIVFGFALDDLGRLLDEPPFAPTPLPAITPSATP